MPTIHETAYPRLKNIFTKEELGEQQEVGGLAFKA